jgi:hypothetical protein
MITGPSVRDAIMPVSTRRSVPPSVSLLGGNGRILGGRHDEDSGDLPAEVGSVDGVTRGQQLHTTQPPKPLQGRLGPPRGGEEDVRVQEDPVHPSRPGGLVVRDPIRIQAHGADLGHGIGVVGGVDGVG